MNYKEKTQMNMPDIDIIGGEGGVENDPWTHPPIRPIPSPMDGGRNSHVTEGCVCVALLSLATTVISLLMLKAKIM